MEIHFLKELLITILISQLLIYMKIYIMELVKLCYS